MVSKLAHPIHGVRSFGPARSLHVSYRGLQWIRSHTQHQSRIYQFAGPGSISNRSHPPIPYQVIAALRRLCHHRARTPWCLGSGNGTVARRGVSPTAILVPDRNLRNVTPSLFVPSYASPSGPATTRLRRALFKDPLLGEDRDRSQVSLLSRVTYNSNSRSEGATALLYGITFLL